MSSGQSAAGGALGRFLRRLKWPAVAALGLVAAALVYVLDPSRGGIFPPCLFHKLTGLYCPGCGSTRALHQILHGHLLAALRFNPLTVLALPLLIGATGLQVLRHRGLIAPAQKPTRPQWIWGLFWLIVAFWVLRNMPWRPFTLLAPHADASPVSAPA